MLNAATADPLVDKEESAVGSPTTSISSMFSEAEPDATIQRSSPFTIGQSSPLSTFNGGFQRPDYLTAPAIDSETSSRSSLDGSLFGKETTAERLEKFKVRSKRKKSSASSSSEEEPLEREEEEDGGVSRKISKALSDDMNTARGIDAPRGRIAHIRRESNCSVDSEAAHERYFKAGQKVSTGFDDFSIDPDRYSPGHTEMRRRAPSISFGEPISINTNAFLPHSCSPSPTRPPDIFKQCYSPSTQQIVRPNLVYTPSPGTSPTHPTQSPTRHGRKLLRSESPIQRSLKRKLTSLDIEIEGKRAFVQRNNTSPLVSERMFPYPNSSLYGETNEFASPYSVPPSPNSIDSHRFRPSFLSRDMTPDDASSSKDDDSSSVCSVNKDDRQSDDVPMRDDETSSSKDVEDMAKPSEDKEEQMEEDGESLLAAAVEAPLPDNKDDF